MNRNEAQARLSSGLTVYACVKGEQHRQQIKLIGLTMCHSITNRRMDNKNVEFSP